MHNSIKTVLNEKSTQRDANIVHAGYSKVQTPPTHPPITNTHTQTDRTDYKTLCC